LVAEGGARDAAHGREGELLCMEGRASCASGLGTERLRPIDFLEWDGSGSEENIP
jgi:hypothetical protein